MYRNLQSASRNRWSASPEWAQPVLATPMLGLRAGAATQPVSKSMAQAALGVERLGLGAPVDASWHSPGSVRRRECNTAPSDPGPSESHSRALLSRMPNKTRNKTEA